VMLTRQLSVCLLTPLFYPVLGGAETHTLTLALGLKRRGHDVTVITDLRDGRSLQSEDLSGVRVLRTSSYRRDIDGPGRVPWEESMFGLLRDLRTFSEHRCFDIIHAQNQVSTVLGAMMKQSIGCPLVCTMHEVHPELDPYGSGRSELIYRFLPYDLLIAGSDYYREQALTFGAQESRVKLIYHGIDADRFHPGVGRGRLRERLQIGPDVPLIVVPGRFKPRKGQLEFVRAMKQVVERIPKARACLVGGVSSSPAEYLRTVKSEILRLDLENAVRVLDDEYRWDDMPEIYIDADIVVQPSHSEGLGLAILEAMACEKPVIGTRVSGIREVISEGESGLLVSPKDPVGLSEAIVGLLLDSERAVRLGAAARDRVRLHFSAGRMVEEVEMAYMNLSLGIPIEAE